MKYLESAPQGLCKLHTQWLENHSALSDAKALLQRLVTDKRMNPVWRYLRKHYPNDGWDYDYLVFAWTYEAWHDRGLRRDTRSAKEERYRDIATLANALAQQLENSLCDVPPYYWFFDAEATSLEGFLKDPFPHGIRRRDYDRPQDFLEAALPAPALSTLLRAVADEADRIAGRAKKEPRLLPNPNAPNAGRLFFIRAMATHFKQHFGQYQRRTLAALTSVALEEEVTLDQVKDALRNWPPDTG